MNRKETRLLVENWRRLLNEENFNDDSLFFDELLEEGLMDTAGKTGSVAAILMALLNPAHALTGDEAAKAITKSDNGVTARVVSKTPEKGPSYSGGEIKFKDFGSFKLELENERGQKRNVTIPNLERFEDSHLEKIILKPLFGQDKNKSLLKDIMKYGINSVLDIDIENTDCDSTINKSFHDSEIYNKLKQVSKIGGNDFEFDQVQQEGKQFYLVIDKSTKKVLSKLKRSKDLAHSINFIVALDSDGSLAKSLSKNILSGDELDNSGFYSETKYESLTTLLDELSEPGIFNHIEKHGKEDPDFENPSRHLKYLISSSTCNDDIKLTVQKNISNFYKTFHSLKK